MSTYLQNFILRNSISRKQVCTSVRTSSASEVVALPYLDPRTRHKPTTLNPQLLVLNTLKMAYTARYVLRTYVCTFYAVAMVISWSCFSPVALLLAGTVRVLGAVDSPWLPHLVTRPTGDIPVPLILDNDLGLDVTMRNSICDIPCLRSSERIPYFNST